MRGWAHAAFGALLFTGVWAAGCSANKQGNAGAGGTAGAGATAGAAGSAGAGGCQTADDCPAGQVCDPAGHGCTAGLPCSKHADCGAIAYCQSGTCAPSVPGGPCDTTTSCVSGETCTDGLCGCGGALYGAESVPPNVLIVLDRSSSMNDPIAGGTKWTVAKQALNELLGAYGAGVHFGLMLFPGYNLAGDKGMDCGSGTTFVPPGPMTAATISEDLDAAGTTMFGTPTAEALAPLVNDNLLKDTSRSNYILLLTDGKSTCNDPVPVVATLLAGAPSIKTFVVGFGDAVDPAQLNDLAQAGGTANPQIPFYHEAGDAASLGAAFDAIAGTVLSCSYALSKIPPDPTQLYVYVDGKALTDGAIDGWTYDAATNQITFLGATCNALKSGVAKEILISYGCPIPEAH